MYQCHQKSPLVSFHRYELFLKQHTSMLPLLVSSVVLKIDKLVDIDREVEEEYGNTIVDQYYLFDTCSKGTFLSSYKIVANTILVTDVRNSISRLAGMSAELW